MNKKDSLIMEEYRENKENFEQLGNIVQGILEQLVKDAGIRVMTVEHRVKKEKSLEGKLYRKGDQYQSLKDITDILDTRVVCYFSDDVDVIGSMVERKFIVDSDNSVDKRKLLQANSFGYLSLHYVCSLSADAGYPPEVCGKRFEIVDEEFMRVRDNMNSYTEQTRDKIIHDGEEDVLIDIVSLKEYMLRNQRMLEENEELALKIARDALGGTELDIVSSNVALRFLCMARLLSGGTDIAGKHETRCGHVVKKYFKHDIQMTCFR